MAQPDPLPFVTGNPGKVRELRAHLAPFGVAVEQEARSYPEIQADTLEAVARAGAEHLIDEGLQPPFVLEDSGLFVAALRGFPGVYSRHAFDTIGCQGLLRLLRDVEEEMRGAHFEACLLYVDGAGGSHPFRGVCGGRIATRAGGGGGFGFDPIFVPTGQERTFARLSQEEKGRISHRGQAAALLGAWLSKQQKHKRGTAWSRR